MARRRRRNHQRDDDIEFHASDRWIQSSSNPGLIEDIPLGPYTVIGLGRRNNFNRNSFRPNPNSNSRQSRDLFHSTSNPSQPQRTHRTFPQGDIAFRLGSSGFKRYLLQTIDHTLHQIQLWYPDENTVGDSEMDWQPETEFIIPQPGEEIHYIWDPEPVSRQSDQNENSGISCEVGRELARRAASDGSISLEAGRSLGGSLGGWRSPSPSRSDFAVWRATHSSSDMEAEI